MTASKGILSAFKFLLRHSQLAIIKAETTAPHG